jgi:hypothetical protein
LFAYFANRVGDAQPGNHMSPPSSKPLPRRHPNTKRTGELAEAAFVVKAAGLGFAVSKPWGDSERYDFILDAGHCTWRVQIKCTESTNAGGYQVQSTFSDRKQKGHYTADDIDILVAYILPLDLWYIVPAHALPQSASLRFYPEGNTRKPRFEQYREAWNIFQKPKPPKDRRRARESAAEAITQSDANTNKDTDLATEAPPDPPTQPESPLERMMNQWSARVNNLYFGRKK